MIPIIHYSHYYWVGGPPNLYMLSCSAFRVPAPWPGPHLGMKPYMSHSLKSLKGCYLGDYTRENFRAY